MRPLTHTFLFLALASLSQGFTIVRQRRLNADLRSLPNFDDGEGSENEKEQQSTLDVIQQCMGISAAEPDGLIVRPAQEGISGFAVDPDLGFVAILTNQRRQCTYVVVSGSDKSGQLQSPEALCMVQLAGGLDLGTPILPPECLAKLVSDKIEMPTDEIRPRLKLLEVHVVTAPTQTEETPTDEGLSTAPVPTSSTPQRKAKLISDLPKLMKSMQNLPGLKDCTENQVLEAMELHSDAEGNIDRLSFTAILDTLRRSQDASATISDVLQFQIVVSMDGKRIENRIPVQTAVQGLGLAMRYNKMVQVSEECPIEMDADEIMARFPAFRPIEELKEDARVMDNFIPSVFAKVTAPKADDRA